MLSELLLSSTHLFCAQKESSCCIPWWQPGLDGLHGKSLYGGVRKGLRPLLCKGSLLLPFISITSHQISSPTEVATVPLAIKIMLGHAMLVCDFTVGNKSSGSSRNDANSWVVNLEQCRRKPSLWFLQETESRASFTSFNVNLTGKYQTKRQQDTASSHLCLLFHFRYTAIVHKKACIFFFKNCQYLNRLEI